MRLNARSVLKGICQCRDKNDTTIGFLKDLGGSLRWLHLEGRLIRCKDSATDPRVYLVQNGQKRWFPSLEHVELLDLYDTQVREVSIARMQRLREGPPVSVSAAKRAARWNISNNYLRGNGIEIGALHAPLRVSPEATVRYVDLVPPETSAQISPHLNGFVTVDVLDDGEILSTIQDDSLDFIIANHFLEHCMNPLGTIRIHLQKIRPGGILYYAIPNCELTFDRERAITPFEHLVADDREGGETSKWSHYLDYAKHVDHKLDPDEQHEQALKLQQSDNRIHFHVWDAAAVEDMLRQAVDYLGGAFSIRETVSVDNEVICVLQKADTTSSPDISST
jgi:SAM-dependent methyltransferase